MNLHNDYNYYDDCCSYTFLKTIYIISKIDNFSESLNGKNSKMSQIFKIS